LCHKVLLCIGETFKGAKGIQTWLNICARLIARSIPEDRFQTVVNEKGETVLTLPKCQVKKEQMTSVIWTTPLGLPIVQPYRKTARKQVMTAIQSVFISDPNVPAEGECFDVKSEFVADLAFSWQSMRSNKLLLFLRTSSIVWMLHI
jgi:DNA-directed RNA polymerase